MFWFLCLKALCKERACFGALMGRTEPCSGITNAASAETECFLSEQRVYIKHQQLLFVWLSGENLQINLGVFPSSFQPGLAARLHPFMSLSGRPPWTRLGARTTFIFCLLSAPNSWCLQTSHDVHTKQSVMSGTWSYSLTATLPTNPCYCSSSQKLSVLYPDSEGLAGLRLYFKQQKLSPVCICILYLYLSGLICFLPLDPPLDWTSSLKSGPWKSLSITVRWCSGDWTTDEVIQHVLVRAGCLLWLINSPCSATTPGQACHDCCIIAWSWSFEQTAIIAY